MTGAFLKVWQKGKLGEGTFKSADTRVVYQGNWIEGKRQGNGIRSGCGTAPLNDGTWYKSEWKNNIPDGNGSIYDKEGKLVF